MTYNLKKALRPQKQTSPFKKRAGLGLVLILLFSVSHAENTISNTTQHQTNTLQNEAAIQQHSSVPSPTQHTIAKQSTTPYQDADQLLLQSPVIDQADILSAHEKQQLEHKIRHIYQRGLAQIAIVTVSTTHHEPIFDYSFKIAERWKLGKKGIDNGILIVAAINDRKAYILTGYGIEGTIPDSITSRMIREDMAPHFRQNNYYEGFDAVLNHIEQRLTADPDILSKADAEQASRLDHDERGSPFGLLFVLFFFIGPLIYSILGRFLGATVFAGIGFAMCMALGFSLFSSLILGIIIWTALFVFSLDRLFLQMRGTAYSSRTSGGRIGGGFGSGGFGGGYSGGGGSFGGGGAGGSW